MNSDEINQFNKMAESGVEFIFARLDETGKPFVFINGHPASIGGLVEEIKKVAIQRSV